MRELDRLEPDIHERAPSWYHVDGLDRMVDWPNRRWVRSLVRVTEWSDPVGESVADRVGLAQAWRFVGKVTNKALGLLIEEGES
jgi:hypothetical protein